MRITIDPAIVAKNFALFENNASLQESAQLFAKGLPIAEMIQALAMNRSVLSAFAGFQTIYPHGTSRPVKAFVPVRIRLVTPISMGRC